MILILLFLSHLLFADTPPPGKTTVVQPTGSLLHADIDNFPSSFGVTQSTTPWITTANIGTTNGLALNSTLLTINTTLGSPFQVGGLIGNSFALDSTLVALSAKFGSLGQKNMAGSAPVVIASDQSSLPVTGTFFQSIQPVSQSGTWTTGRTWSLLNTTDSVNVGNFPATQPVSGTVTANQGGTWNINNVSGTVSLPTGAATAVAQGSTTSGQSGSLVQGAVTTSAPTYTTTQTNPLSLTTSGALRVDGSGSTQPVSGSVTANAGTNLNTSALALDASISTLNTSVNTLLKPANTLTAITSITNPVTVAQATAANLNATITGSVTANAGTNLNTSLLALDTSVNGLLTAQGSTTSGQSGPLVQTATTTNAPTYTTAKTNPLSTDTSGLLRVSLKDTPANTNKFLVTADAITFASPQHTIVDSGSITANAGTNLNTSALALDSTVAKDASLTTINTSINTLLKPANTLTAVTTITNPVTVSQSTAANLNATVTGTVGVTQSTTPWITAANTTTTGGMTPFRNTALSNTAVAVKASAGNLYYYHVYNTNTTDCYFQLYDVAQGSVTVGTTTPTLTLAIPAGGLLDGSFDSAPMSFATAITIAQTTTVGGASACTTGLLTALGYK